MCTKNKTKEFQFRNEKMFTDYMNNELNKTN